MGPEHSHARLERFLTLAADDNIQVVQPSTPAQYFHVLRRQVKRCWRKPLVVMTPKSLLRNPRAVSSLEECAEGHFRTVIADAPSHAAPPERILLASGKICYELLHERERLGREGVAIVRIEQLYPFPHDVLAATLSAYPDGTPAYWVQEEPENMGAWRTLRVQFGETLLAKFPFAVVSRPASASPATGSASSHRHEQEGVLMQAFGES
jgi:2-oxoglutarate dehydrogenase E1 component